jgi:hypothetical protein
LAAARRAWTRWPRSTARWRRAPFNFYRLVRAIAAGDPFYEVRFGEGDIPGTRRLEFYGPDGELGGWIILNARKEPMRCRTRWGSAPKHGG